MEIRRLKAEDYDELLGMLNYTFGHKYGRKMDFTAEQPKMWIRDDEHMNKHLGVFEDGKLCSVVGMYPLPVNILGRKMTFATTGNVATLPEYEGRGYFSALFPLIMEECDKQGVVAARLGGSRQRYGRYGFEQCGTLYKFTISAHNVKHFFGDAGAGTEFVRITTEDTDALMICHELISSRPFYVERSPLYNLRDVYLVMCSKEGTPYLALKGGNPIGYLVAYKNGREILELCAYDTEGFSAIVAGWQMHIGGNITVPVAPYQTEELRMLSECADDISITNPSKFRVHDWVTLCDALMKLKASLEPLPDFELTLGVEDYGSFTLYCRSGVAGCEWSNRSGELLLDQRSASRLLFGPAPASLIADVPVIARAWLPLPLTWATNDYV